MLAWLKPRLRTRKIILDPEFGYVAAANDGFGWWAIDDSGATGVALVDAANYHHRYFVKTIEQAGERINKHATRRGQKTVWTGS